MKKRTPHLPSRSNFSMDAIETAKLEWLSRDWFSHSKLKQHSPRTIENRRLYLERLFEFLAAQEAPQCGRTELRAFFDALNNTKTGAALRPSTAETYHRNFAAFFNWLVSEGELELSPMARVPKPVVPRDQIQPLSVEQQLALIKAARDSHFGLRNQALVLFMLDTGARASEVCGIKVGDLDLEGRKVMVTGKGNKRRCVYFGKRTARSMQHYLPKERKLRPEASVFIAETGNTVGEPMLRGGILQIVHRCGVAARLQGVRCSPHTLRHTFAVNFLKNGGNSLSLKVLLGHTDLTMTQRYVSFAEADLEEQHRANSPVDRLSDR